MAHQEVNFDPERERIELRYQNSTMRDYVFPRTRFSLDSTPETSIEQVTSYNLKIQNKIKPPPLTISPKSIITQTQTPREKYSAYYNLTKQTEENHPKPKGELHSTIKNSSTTKKPQYFFFEEQWKKLQKHHQNSMNISHSMHASQTIREKSQFCNNQKTNRLDNYYGFSKMTQSNKMAQTLLKESMNQSCKSKLKTSIDQRDQLSKPASKNRTKLVKRRSPTETISHKLYQVASPKQASFHSNSKDKKLKLQQSNFIGQNNKLSPEMSPRNQAQQLMKKSLKNLFQKSPPRQELHTSKSPKSMRQTLTSDFRKPAPQIQPQLPQGQVMSIVILKALQKLQKSQQRKQ